MPKKDKEIKRLRREVEILRAQLKGARGPEETNIAEEPKKESRVSPELSPPSLPSLSYVRSDLRRSLIITAAIMAVIGSLAFSQPYWPKIVTLTAKVLPF